MDKSTNWISIAPIRDLYQLPRELDLPFEFGNRVCLERLPAWLLDESGDNVDLLLPRLRQEADDFHVRYCLAARYEADAIGTPDPEWPGKEKRAIQDSAIDRIYIAALSMWLAYPTAAGYTQVSHTEREGDDPVVRQFHEFDRFRPLKQYRRKRLRHEHLLLARDYFSSISDLPRTSTVFSAVGALGSALIQSMWHLRYLNLWLALECLFGPEDSREITYRISQRIGMFLGTNRKEARNIFDRVKKSYGWRSKIVHGLRLSKLTPEDSESLIYRLEHTVRHSIITILGNEQNIGIFNGKGREKFLDDLVFTEIG